MEALQAQHRKQQRDLQAQITQRKKSATKKTRRGVNEECERLERELGERQGREIEALGLRGGSVDEDGDGDGDGNDGGAMAVAGEGDLDRLTLEGGVEGKESEKARDGDGEMKHDQEQEKGQEEVKAAKKKPSRQKARLARRAAEVEALSAAAENEAGQQTDHRALEREAMAKQIEDLGLQEKEIRSDGHCMYSAVAHSLSSFNGEKIDYQAVRERTADFIRRHREDYEPFLDEEEQGGEFEGYVHKVGQTAEWGGELELAAIARWSGRKVRVVQGMGGVREIGGAEEEAGKEKKGEDIWLAYYRKSFGLGEHYNALESKKKIS